MLKFVISSIFFGSTILGFSAQSNPFSEETTVQELISIVQRIPPEEFVSAVEYIKSHENFYEYMFVGLGMFSLDAEDYSSAIDNLNRAEAVHKKSIKPQPELDFVISFCKTVAYDNLGLHKECCESLGSLVLLSYEMGRDSSDSDEESSNEEPDEVAGFLQKLASRAKSANLKGFLLESMNDSDE